MSKRYQLEDLIEYSSEGVIKREVHKGDDFNIVVVCLDKKQQIPVHFESYDTFFFVISGSGLFIIGEQELKLEEEEMIFSPSGDRGIKALEKLCVLGVQQPH